MDLAPLKTARLRLEPVTAEMARAILAGDMSVLAAAGLTAAEGWPHEDTADGLGMIVKTGEALSWLVVADGAVIGDCGLHGPVDEAGRVEIGYGLAAPRPGEGGLHLHRHRGRRGRLRARRAGRLARHGGDRVDGIGDGPPVRADPGNSGRGALQGPPRP
jgi:GNAT acetyltransferase-like protein